LRRGLRLRLAAGYECSRAKTGQEDDQRSGQEVPSGALLRPRPIARELPASWQGHWRPSSVGHRHAVRQARFPEAHQPSGQSGSGRGLTQLVHPALKHPERGDLIAARHASRHVEEHALALASVKLTVDQRG
jgi:hypothetical protein